MKVKFANRIYEVLFTKELAGLTMYAVEDEPNHIDWLINVEVVDAEEKELKKIEQKPDTQHSTEWSVSDFRTWQYIVSDVLTKKDGIGQYLDSGECKKIAKYMQEEWGGKLGKEQTQEELRKGEDYGIDGLYHAISILEKTLGKVDGYQSDDGILEHKCAISAVKKLYEQNPWSEEDEKMFECALNMIEWYGVVDEDKSKPVSDWLKSLKDRVQPQPKREWSEEDEKNLNWLTTVCERIHYKNDPQVAPECALILKDWLKSLKERYTWKPSDEQMAALLVAVGDEKKLVSDVGKELYELYLQLKQL